MGIVICFSKKKCSIFETLIYLSFLSLRWETGEEVSALEGVQVKKKK